MALCRGSWRTGVGKKPGKLLSGRYSLVSCYLRAARTRSTPALFSLCRPHSTYLPTLCPLTRERGRVILFPRDKRNDGLRLTKAPCLSSSLPTVHRQIQLIHSRSLSSFQHKKNITHDNNNNNPKLKNIFCSLCGISCLNFFLSLRVILAPGCA